MTRSRTVRCRWGVGVCRSRHPERLDQSCDLAADAPHPDDADEASLDVDVLRRLPTVVPLSGLVAARVAAHRQQVHDHGVGDRHGRRPCGGGQAHPPVEERVEHRMIRARANVWNQRTFGAWAAKRRNAAVRAGYRSAEKLTTSRRSRSRSSSSSVPRRVTTSSPGATCRQRSPSTACASSEQKTTTLRTSAPCARRRPPARRTPHPSRTASSRRQYRDGRRRRELRRARLRSEPEVRGHLVGSTAFKAAETGDPRLAGSIPVHLRQPSSDARGHTVSRPARCRPSRSALPAARDG